MKLDIKYLEKVNKEKLDDADLAIQLQSQLLNDEKIKNAKLKFKYEDIFFKDNIFDVHANEKNYLEEEKENVDLNKIDDKKELLIGNIDIGKKKKVSGKKTNKSKTSKSIKSAKSKTEDVSKIKLEKNLSGVKSETIKNGLKKK